MPKTSSTLDAVVVGAGFGGLSAALHIAEAGGAVCLVEALNYPGGCASTFRRAGYQFESGATLFSGFGPGQLFRKLIDKHQMDVTVDFLDPVVTLRTSELTLPIPAQRENMIQLFLDLPGAPQNELLEFFQYQRRVADLLWDVLNDPALLPPFTLAAFWRHAARAPRYLTLLPLLGKPLKRVLEQHGLGAFAPLRTFLDALCQITIQCSADEAEAPFALATMDYYFRGTGHVRGGIGTLAWAMAKAITHLGGDIRFANSAKSIERDGSEFVVHTRTGPIRARKVVSNLLPKTTLQMLNLRDGENGEKTLTYLNERVEAGWGACLLYLAAFPPADEDGPCHIEVVQDPALPFVEGNHLFCSVSGPEDGERAPNGQRTMTVSTHVPMAKFRALSPEKRGDYIATVQETMREGLRQFLPEWWKGVQKELTASPRTFERFTGRPFGLVGGVPRRAGLHNYEHLGPTEVLPGLYLVGDSVFPGQSTLATALSGIKAAEQIAKRLGLTAAGG